MTCTSCANSACARSCWTTATCRVGPPTFCPVASRHDELRPPYTGTAGLGGPVGAQPVRHRAHPVGDRPGLGAAPGTQPVRDQRPESDRRFRRRRRYVRVFQNRRCAVQGTTARRRRPRAGGSCRSETHFGGQGAGRVPHLLRVWGRVGGAEGESPTARFARATEAGVELARSVGVVTPIFCGLA